MTSGANLVNCGLTRKKSYAIVILNQAYKPRIFTNTSAPGDASPVLTVENPAVQGGDVT
jgi:hypothetical protein